MTKRLTIIGGGPGGYTAAFAAAKAGLDVTLVESAKIGGTCLNHGCIPTKTLRASADALETAQRLATFGIDGAENVRVNPAAVLARKRQVITTLQGGLEKACKALKVRLLQGRGQVIDATRVDVTLEDGTIETVNGDNVIIATGSSVLHLPGMPIDHKYVLTSDDMLEMERIPEHLLIVGGGVIGSELAFIYHAFGSKVTVVEGANRVLPMPSVDADVSTLMQREMKKRRITLETNRTLTDVRVENGKVYATLTPFNLPEDAALPADKPVEADALLVSIGRVPNIEGLGLAEAGITTDNRGWIVADAGLETSVPGVYAIGDVLGPTRVMLAHVAAMEGLCALRNIMREDGEKESMDYTVVPSGIFTAPEVGSVGLSEAQAKAAGYEVRCSTFQMRELGKAQAMAELPGMFKLIADAATDKLLGAHIVGAHATDLIAEATLALSKGATVQDVARTIHAHPTLAEGFYEAAVHLTAEKI